ncbi:MAG: hypothetical protein LBV72_08110 [Tannerella sp.]|jgi:hypothetical protein|nr:hypothetical protein [Tannerella sp.]
MNEINELKRFLNFPISSTQEIFNEFKTINGHIFMEKSKDGKERFLYIEGKRENKVLLVAHADTYFDMFYDYPQKTHKLLEHSNVLKAIDENGEAQLLGADDRAGVAMLWLLKDSGHSLLITDGEEHGRIGSRWLIYENKHIAKRINQVHQFIIQLDRCNGKDFKCYDVGTDEFRDFIKERTNYSEPDLYSYTDICTLCTDICGVNFSVGYDYEHSKSEMLNIDEWLNTFNVVRELLRDEHLPKYHLPK